MLKLKLHKRVRLFLTLFILLIPNLDLFADELWSENFYVPENGRPNPYNLSEPELHQAIEKGKIHALNYPVSVTETLIPYQAFENLLTAASWDPFKLLIQKLFQQINSFHNFNDLERWLGLQPYPQSPGDFGVYYVPFPQQQTPEHRMGFTLRERDGTLGFTISCAECHAGNLFGKKVIGLTNRFPRANAAFVMGLKAFASVDPWFFQWATDATNGEREMYEQAKFALQFVTARYPLRLGLDTSLAQVALSLSLRQKDEWASRSISYHATYEPLKDIPADSKPSVWWNVRYKNRWLSDGSVISGNPIFTNFLWNEIGRGIDLHSLDKWLQQNQKTIVELTTAVFSSEAPRWTDFFPATANHLQQAKRGQVIFNKYCSGCHGQYQKGWETAGSFESLQEEFLTTRVDYPQPTPVFNVGTDSYRYKGMSSLKQLNNLYLSKANQTVIATTQGYVPPPLVGIWARWPYLHNNSVPNLCELLTVAKQRSKGYWSGEANNPKTDFDEHCNGYPLGSLTPSTWKNEEHYYDSGIPGQSHSGHDEGIFVLNGQNILTEQNRNDLIRFLQTL